MNFDSLVQSIGKLAKDSQILSRQAVELYTPVVEAIVRSRCQDARHIEHTLDGLLGFCFDSEALRLYRQLCRYYYGLDPAATAAYVHAYREMWDSETKDQPCAKTNDTRSKSKASRSRSSIKGEA